MRCTPFVGILVLVVAIFDPSEASATFLCRTRCRPNCQSECTPVIWAAPNQPPAMVKRKMTVTVEKTVNGKKVKETKEIEVLVPADALPSVQNEIAELKAAIQQQSLQQQAIDAAQNDLLREHDDKLKKPNNP